MKTTQTVLVIDDEVDIRNGVGRWLEYSGYETCFADNGDMGIGFAMESPPDAILLDVQMPKKDGMQTLAELRACPRTQDIPVVMLSASLGDEQRALEAGAKFFVQKPYEGKKLVCAVEAAISQR